MNARSVTVSVTPALVPAIALLQNMHDKVMALPDLKSLERTVHEQLKEVDRLTMELCLVDKIRQSAPALTYEVRCRHCGPGWAVRSAPAAPRYAITVRGRVDYTRPVYRCDQPGCGRERSPGKERPVLLRRAYCATSRGIRPFGAMVWALANWWGVRSARRVAVVGDGIDWIWNWSRDRLHFALPDGGIQAPVEIVDFWHGAENLAKARGAIYADPEGSAARAWFERWRHRLRQGEIEPLVKELKRRAARAGGEAARHELSLRAQYFAGHAHRMRYPEFEAMGLPIGSGAIEGTCKNLIKGRMDGVGMRWDADKGIELMTALRVRLFNERWDDLWSQSENIEDAA